MMTDLTKRLAASVAIVEGTLDADTCDALILGLRKRSEEHAAAAKMYAKRGDYQRAAEYDNRASEAGRCSALIDHLAGGGGLRSLKFVEGK